VIFYPDTATFKTGCTYYNVWRYLFYCQHKNIPFYQTKVLWYSIGAGAIASLSCWVIMLIFLRIVTILRRRFR
jgi:hypothetical protein